LVTKSVCKQSAYETGKSMFRRGPARGCHLPSLRVQYLVDIEASKWGAACDSL
jgi:hypothetical protein